MRCDEMGWDGMGWDEMAGKGTWEGVWGGLGWGCGLLDYVYQPRSARNNGFTALHLLLPMPAPLATVVVSSGALKVSAC